MTLSDILAEIAEKYPHSLDNESIVRKINNLQRRIFRKYKLTVSKSIEILADQALYPNNIPQAQIREVLVNGKIYPHKNLESFAPSRYIYFIDGGIGIFPTPKEAGEFTLFYYKAPTRLTTSNLNVVPDLDEDFHMLLVYGVCKEIAENYQDFDLVNGFISQYNALLDDLLESNQDMSPAQIQEEVWW